MGRVARACDRLRRWLRRRWVARACAAAFVVSLPVALIGGNVRYLFGEQRLYNFAIEHFDADSVSGVPKPELLRATRELRRYLFNSDERLNIQVTDIHGQTGSLFTEREIVHMHDVKRLAQRIFRAQEVALLVTLAYPALRILLFRRDGLRGVLEVTWLTGLGLNLAGVGFAGGAALGFDELFTRFHELSFSNDFWQLDPRTDHLVQMFPFQFWEVAAALLVAMTLVESALLAAGARWGLARLDRGEPAAAEPKAQVDQAEQPAPEIV